MSNEMMLFENDEFGKVRVAEVGGEHYFALKDVLEAQGAKTHTTQAITAIEQGLGDGYVIVVPIKDSLGRDQEAKFISESAVTFLVSRSNTERGRRCNRWIHTEILPSIRKHGAYMTDSVIDQVMASPAIIYKMAETMLQERNLREIAEAKIKADEPKVKRSEAVMDLPDTISIGTMASILKQKGLNMGQNKLFKALREHKFLLSQHDRYNHPAQKWINEGLFKLEEIINEKHGCVRYKTKVTGKGQTYLVNYFCSIQ